MRFRARHRLRANKDFALIRKSGKRHSFAGFLVQALAHEKWQTGRRIGFRVSRKVGNAVTRNHAKRYFRELFRIHQEELPEQCNLVIVVHPTLPKMNRKRIEEDFIKLCRRISALAIT